MSAARYDVIVVGAGQAGLAMGQALQRRGLRILLLDAARDLASAWRARWDSLRLFTPARWSALPGLPFPGDPDRCPARDEVVAYLEAYARAFALPVALDEPVRDLRLAGDAGFLVRTDHARYRARHVVVATGAYQRPWTPPLAATLPAGVTQLHAAAYRRPGQLPDGPVVVVGGGNTGVQLAAELAAHRDVTLALGARLPRVPAALLGRSLFWWLERSGAMTAHRESWLGRRTRREVLVGASPGDVARSRGVRLAGRVIGADGAALHTADGGRLEAATVLWATGYRGSWPWLQVPVLDAHGQPAHRDGVTDVPGLYFLGLPWLTARGSTLLGWVGRDAARLAGHIAARHGPARATAPRAPASSRAPRSAAGRPGGA